MGKKEAEVQGKGYKEDAEDKPDTKHQIMTEAQLTATQIAVNDITGMLIAIGNKDYAHFRELKQAFVSQHGEEVWEQVFNFRVLPALDKPANQ